jgi:integrase
MARLGSIKYQVSQILQKVNGIGTSKKESREQSGVKSLESGHKISVKVHSFKSLENLKNDLTNLAAYAKNEFKITDIKAINIDIVSSWIESKEISYNTASNYLSELNKVSDHFNFAKEEIKDLRAELKGKLSNNELTSRAYAHLDRVVVRDKHEPAFILQKDYGLRINAATNINIEKQLKGNTLFYKEKGGKIGQKEIPPALVSKLKENAVNGKYEVNKRTYSRELKKEIETKTNQKFNGSHGIRHTYAQSNVAIKRKEEVSQELGHSRAEIINKYLR